MRAVGKGLQGCSGVEKHGLINCKLRTISTSSCMPCPALARSNSILKMAYGFNAGAQRSLFASMDLPFLLPLCLSARICSVVLQLSRFAVSSFSSVKVCSVVESWPYDDPLPTIHMAFVQTVLPWVCLC